MSFIRHQWYKSRSVISAKMKSNEILRKYPSYDMWEMLSFRGAAGHCWMRKSSVLCHCWYYISSKINRSLLRLFFTSQLVAASVWYKTEEKKKQCLNVTVINFICKAINSIVMIISWNYDKQSPNVTSSEEANDNSCLTTQCKTDSLNSMN